MANSVKGEVPLELEDGRKFVLVFDFEALVSAEDAYGKPMHVLMGRVQEGFFGAIRILFWAAMLRHQPSTSLADVTEILTNHSDAIETVLKAYKAAMPDAKGGKEGANPPGKRSGPSGARQVKTPKLSGAKPLARSR